jgi:hypothetical protein
VDYAGSKKSEYQKSLLAAEVFAWLRQSAKDESPTLATLEASVRLHHSGQQKLASENSGYRAQAGRPSVDFETGRIPGTPKPDKCVASFLLEYVLSSYWNSLARVYAAILLLYYSSSRSTSS